MNLVNRNYDLANKLFSEFDRMATSPARQLKTSYSSSPVNAAVNGTDLYETSDAFVLEMAVPGIKRENIEISLEGRNLDIRASYNAVTPQKDASVNAEEGTENVVEAVQEEQRNYHYRSLRLADINRKVHLPESVQIDAIDAKVEDGILVLSMPKAAEAQPRKISVN